MNGRTQTPLPVLCRECGNSTETLPGDLAKQDVTPDWRPEKKPKTAKKPRSDASPERKAEIRAKKCRECRVCGTTAGLIHAHHLVRRGAPHFGAWTENNIIGLCAQCHTEYHATGYGSRVKKILRVRLTVAEVAYSDRRAYEGWVDDLLWRIRPVTNDEEKVA